MKTKINLNSWNRKEHFEYFRTFDEPFYTINVNIDFTSGFSAIKLKNHSVFAWYLYNAMKASNAVKEFRYRIEEDEVFEYEIVHASPTVGRDDGTFGFAQVDFVDDFLVFQSNLKAEIERVKNLPGLFTAPERIDVIHYSALPWFSLTGSTHPRNFNDRDSIPKITFSKIFKRESKMWLPISITVHHGLIDGYHVGLYVEKYTQLLNNCNL